MRVEAVVLAGGIGERMGEATRDTQKCLLPIDGIPVLGHVIDSLVSAFGSVDLKLGVSYKAEQVKEFVERYKPESLRVEYIPHAPKSESFGAYKSIAGFVTQPFVGAPGDIVAPPEVYERVYTSFADGDNFASLTLSPKLDVVTSHAIGTIKDSQVERLIYPSPPLEEIPEGYLRDVTIFASDPKFFSFTEKLAGSKQPLCFALQEAINDGKSIGAVVFEGHWVHLATVRDLERSMRPAVGENVSSYDRTAA